MSVGVGGPDPAFVVGVDLGQSQDFTAIAVNRVVRLNPGSAGAPEYAHAFLHLERPKLGTPYPVVVQRVCALCASLPAPPLLVVDETGVGRAVLDLLRLAAPRSSWLLPVTITAGYTPAPQPDGGWHVPKRDLVAAVQVALQNRRLRVATALPEARTLTQELLNFRARITASGNVTYAVPDWREGQHDDLVLATALAVWAADRTESAVRWIM